MAKLPWMTKTAKAPVGKAKKPVVVKKTVVKKGKK